MNQLPDRIDFLQRNLDRLQRHIDSLQPRSNRYSWLRVLTFVLGLALSALLLFVAGVWFFWGGVVVTLLLFGVSVYLHNQIETALQAALTLQQIKRTQMARIRLDWANLPPAGQQPRYTHPFEADLDLVGPRSLHRLLDSTTTQEASQQLREWLTATTPPPVTALVHRQTLVRELLPRVHFRNKLQMYGHLLRSDQAPWSADHLLLWLQPHASIRVLHGWVIGLSGLALLNALLFLLNRLDVLPSWWQLTLGLYAILYFWHGRTLSHTFEEAKTLEDDVGQLAGVFRHLERYGYHGAPALRTLCTPFLTGEQRPSHYLRRINRIVTATGVQGNPVLAVLLNAFLPWGLIFAWRLEVWKQAVVTALPHWLRVWHELETLSALAGYGWLNPQTTFPHLHDEESAPVFAVQGIGHPLLPNDRKVRNDFTVNTLGEVALLTGSNMSGKSTLLKAIGVNLALAYAGSVVDAQMLQTLRFRLFTCIKVSDSVTDGISYFYAEVQRLKALLDDLAVTDDLPLFFAVDEIFRGTNNRERLIGSRAYIRALVGRRGIGLISTHDLELIRLEEEMNGITNYHFRDDIVEGRMVFDYRLRRGPSPTTNALRIMASEGLPVEGDGN